MSESRSRLLNRDFLLLWQGQLVSRLGDQAFFVAQMFWATKATGSATLVGLLLAIGALPGVLLGPLAGAFVDRHSRKAIIVGADVARGIAVLGLALLMMARPDDWEAILVALFIVALWSGILGAAFNPAIVAVIPDLVTGARLQAANSLQQFSSQGAALLGQAVGGVAYRFLGAPLLFLVDGASYLASAFSEAWIRIPAREEPGAAEGDAGDAPEDRGRRGGYLAETLAGLRYVWSWRGMRTFVLTIAGVNFLFMPVFVLLPFYVTDVLGQGAGGYGFLLASMSLGSLTGLATAARAPAMGRVRARLLIAAALGGPALMATLGLVREPLLALVILFGLGVTSALINVFVVTLVQVSSPAEMRGRVVALVMALAGAAVPLGMAGSGIVADLTGRRTSETFVAVGLFATSLVLGAVTRPSFREFLRTEVPRPRREAP